MEGGVEGPVEVREDVDDGCDDETEADTVLEDDLAAGLWCGSHSTASLQVFSFPLIDSRSPTSRVRRLFFGLC